MESLNDVVSGLRRADARADELEERLNAHALEAARLDRRLVDLESPCGCGDAPNIYPTGYTRSDLDYSFWVGVTAGILACWGALEVVAAVKAFRAQVVT